MKRLKKIAKRTLKESLDAIFAWLIGDGEEYYNDNSFMDDLLSENSDCKYSGIGYRTFHFEYEDILEGLINYVGFNGNIENEEESNNVFITKQELINFAKSCIHNDDRYYSWCRTESALDDTKEDFSEWRDGANMIVINADISGIDVKKIINKYNKELGENNIEYLSEFEFQDEIIAKMPSNYDIMELFHIPISQYDSKISLYDIWGNM